MNTNALKKFAQAARKKLMEQVAAKLELVLTTDSAAMREQAAKLQKLREVIDQTSKEQVIDKVAYTWFNRLMALRFMDANDYQPLGIKVITPVANETQPELLVAAKAGSIPDDLKVNRQQINDLLDGKIPSKDAETEVYKLLLIGACNHLSTIFPFLFERIDDYADLLLPDDLLSSFSIVEEMREGMTEEDCSEVELIGWLYQFYISERKDELINAKKRYKADEIAPVTQLFTPKWIVQYMVDNTLGQLWKEARPTTKITNDLEFYIKPANPELIPERKIESVEEIKFFDPCVGSAHVLCYAFDIFYKMYEEEGYNPSDIPELILTKNLFGIDIDDRAAQLAGFALMMKGRKYYRRFFRKQVVPNVTAFQNHQSHPKFENAKVFGSLIKVTPEEVGMIEADSNTLFAERNEQLIKQATLLSQKYDIVVTNPPYLNSSYMEGQLKQFVEKEYKSTKSDLFACFLIQANRLTKKEGLIGFICPYVWMFIKSYEKLREFVIKETTIASLIQLEYNAFGPAVVPIGSFVLRNQFVPEYAGSYVKLSDFKGIENQAPKTIEAIQNPGCSWFFNAIQKNFEKIPGSPLGYWLNTKSLDKFLNTSLGEVSQFKQGIATSNNQRFLRFWYEIPFHKFDLSCTNLSELKASKLKWFPYNKGGSFRKWFGNNELTVNWESNGVAMKDFTSRLPQGTHVRLKSKEFYCLSNVTYSALTSGSFGGRYSETGFLFDTKGSCIFETHDVNLFQILGYLNNKVCQYYLSVLCPTLDYSMVGMKKLPVDNLDKFEDEIVQKCISIAKIEWDSRETSWDFQKNELHHHRGQDLEESYDLYCQYWKNKFFQLHKNEEELNRQFIEIYGLQEELTPDVPLEDITILKSESSIENGELVFNRKEVMMQFVSYAVGCMFGRYSLEQDGLVLANQGETLEDFLAKLPSNSPSGAQPRFLPDDDNIIPVLDDEWFEDDITGRFYEFLKVTFGERDFKKNLAFVEEALGKDIRKYLVKDFYNDHVKRYKKRPIYWMFSSPKGAFNVLIYLHRYTPDTLNTILNDYLVEYREKLKTKVETLQTIADTGSATEKVKAEKEQERLRHVLLELQEYERSTLYPLATERIAIDLDDGVLVNYNKFGSAIKLVKGLNDAKTKKKVRGFDWIEVEEIRD